MTSNLTHCCVKYKIVTRFYQACNNRSSLNKRPGQACSRIWICILDNRVCVTKQSIINGRHSSIPIGCAVINLDIKVIYSVSTSIAKVKRDRIIANVRLMRRIDFKSIDSAIPLNERYRRWSYCCRIVTLTVCVIWHCINAVYTCFCWIIRRRCHIDRGIVDHIHSETVRTNHRAAATSIIIASIKRYKVGCADQIKAI